MTKFEGYLPQSFAACFTQTGLSHIKNNIECEDVYIAKEKKDFLFYGLADGQSGKEYCKQGAHAVLNAIAEYIEKRRINNLAEYEHVDEIQYEIIKIIREKLTRLAAIKDSEVSEFSSTILALGVDPATGRYMTIHLGDGCIFGNRIDGSLNFISTADNGITSRYTWLTTSEGALLHLRIGFGNISNYKRVVMCTDGAESVCRGTSISADVRSILLNDEDSSRIGEIIRDSEPVDDATCIVVDCQKVSENSTYMVAVLQNM